MKFEKALEKLEKIVSDLETGQLSLDDSLKKYEEGIKLSRLCSKNLEEAQSKIEILMKKANGSLEKEPFEAGSDTAEEKHSVTKVRKSSSGKKSEARISNSTSKDDVLF